MTSVLYLVVIVELFSATFALLRQYSITLYSKSGAITMRPAVWIVMTLCIFSGGCRSSLPPLAPAPLPSAAVESSIQVQRGPWNPERVKAAEAVLQTPARTELDRQRAALASAYLQWGEALFTGFEAAAPHVMAPPGEFIAPPGETSGASSVSPLPPQWYWQEKQQQDLDRRLQQQRDQYYRDRQPPPQFSRPPVCNSYQAGGQIYTQCR